MQAFLVWPRNSVAAQLQLFGTTECKVLIVAPDFPLPEPFTAALAARSVKILPSKPQQYWLGHESVPVYAFNTSLDECPERPFVVFHTSGSTGSIVVDALPTMEFLTSFRFPQAHHVYICSSQIVHYPSEP